VNAVAATLDISYGNAALELLHDGTCQQCKEAARSVRHVRSCLNKLMGVVAVVVDENEGGVNVSVEYADGSVVEGGEVWDVLQ